jgi:two-component system, OmpR family, response regulator
VRGLRLLLVEDDAELRAMVESGLEEEGFDVVSAGDGASALRRVGELDPHVLVVDVGLPDTDGRDLCRALRAKGVRTPVLFLTARDAVVDRVAGFNAGGDDYLTKPFAFSELIARVHALTRRRDVEFQGAGGDLEVDPLAQSLRWRGTAVETTPIEFRLISALAAASGTNVPRRKLVDAAWPDGAIVYDNTLDVYIARLRRKLAALDGAPAIVTAVGFGYRLE